MTRTTTILAAAGILAVGASSWATAGSLITGRQIKDGTITRADLAKPLRSALAPAKLRAREADPIAAEPTEPATTYPDMETMPTVALPSDEPMLPALAGNVVRVASTPVPLGTMQSETPITVLCPPGGQAIGGGYARTSAGRVLVESSEPTEDGAGWVVRVTRTGYAPEDTTMRAWAVCLVP